MISKLFPKFLIFGESLQGYDLTHIIYGLLAKQVINKGKYYLSLPIVFDIYGTIFFC